jgi:hypothetical protein
MEYNLERLGGVQQQVSCLPPLQDHELKKSWSSRIYR